MTEKHDYTDQEIEAVRPKHEYTDQEKEAVRSEGYVQEALT
jgi:hypothetical protein